MSNSAIVSNVISMVAQITFMRHEDGTGIKIIGEYDDEHFVPDLVEIISIKDVPYAINNYLKEAERIMYNRSVRALYYLLKAEAVINVESVLISSSKHSTISKTITSISSLFQITSLSFWPGSDLII